MVLNGIEKSIEIWPKPVAAERNPKQSVAHLNLDLIYSLTNAGRHCSVRNVAIYSARSSANKPIVRLAGLAIRRLKAKPKKQAKRSNQIHTKPHCAERSSSLI